MTKEERYGLVADLWRQGVPTKIIADRACYAPESLKYIAKKMGLSHHPNAHRFVRPVKAKEIARARQMRAAGAALVDIARDLNRSLSTIHRWVRR